jgi:Aldo/keto reductase family
MPVNRGDPDARALGDRVQRGVAGRDQGLVGHCEDALAVLPRVGAQRLGRPDPEEASDRAIIDAEAKIAATRGVSRAQVALAWLRHHPVVVAPLVGATEPHHLADAVASLDIELTDDEVAELEAPYTPRADFQGVSDDAELARISARLGIRPAARS